MTNTPNMTEITDAELRAMARDYARKGGLTRGRVTFKICIFGDATCTRVRLVASALTAEGTPGSLSVAL